MTTKEVREKVSLSANPDWYNSIEEQFHFPSINIDQTIKGISAIHLFISRQVKGWEKIDEIPTVLDNSKDFFSNMRKKLESFITNYNHVDNDSNLTNYWRNNFNNFLKNNKRNIFTFDSPQTSFLIELNQERPEAIHGAYKFLIGSSTINAIRSELLGAFLAYEFELKDGSNVVKRRTKEKPSISQYRNNLSKLFSESETALSQHISDMETNYSTYTQNIDDLKTEKDGLFNEWFTTSQNSFNGFVDNAKERISALEQTYEEHLRLEKPADYWSKRASKLKEEGRRSVTWFIVLVVIACITLYTLLWLSPEDMLRSIFKGEASAIRWSIVYITFISFLAFGIKVLSKITFSSFHLARDAEEREHLTYFYLSLIKDSKIGNEQDRNLILQALFSRADTGLLKSDSTPTMPNDITKFFNKS